MTRPRLRPETIPALVALLVGLAAAAVSAANLLRDCHTRPSVHLTPAPTATP